MQDVEERALALTVTSMEQHVARDSPRHVEIDLDILDVRLLHEAVVLCLELDDRRSPSASLERDFVGHLFHHETPHGASPPIGNALENATLQPAVLATLTPTSDGHSTLPPTRGDGPVLGVPARISSRDREHARPFVDPFRLEGNLFWRQRRRRK